MRLVEAANLIAYAAPDHLTLLAGDFNSVSPLDPEPDWKGLPAHFHARYTSPDADTADRRTLQALYRAGYVDLAHRLGGHSQTTVPGAAFKNTEFAPFRADYFLASPPLAEHAASYAVLKDARTDAASDHYPVVAEFRS